ncbi:MAG TPA: dihydrofolate reductase [Kofleriaceae bacterium]|nr:dihydrofolate reductase [Kofleriaceae bacterium]
MSFDVVLAADRDWGIGKTDGPLPWPRLSGDLAHFRRVTGDAPPGRRNAIILGRRTWESPEVAGKPLPKRLNVVISHRALAVVEGVIAVPSLDAALAAARRDATVDTIFVIGGGQIFQQAFADPRLGRVYLTRIDGRFGCDIKIPDLDALGFVADPWDGARDGEDNGVHYRIERLRRG